MDLHCKYFEEKEPIWGSVRSSFPARLCGIVSRRSRRFTQISDFAKASSDRSAGNASGGLFATYRHQFAIMKRDKWNLLIVP